MEERKINVQNIIVGIILMAGCISIGAISAIPHQTEFITTIINVPAQFTEQKDTVSQESVEIALQSNVGVINAINVTTLFKIMVIVSVAGLVFVLLSTTGLAPRFGGMGD
jgi:hypothetical protein